uniref:Uncharacterized protein n=1 Tax=Trichogramma kaykai TaxID=54128 RepID=A0ABD2XKK4_9HYME
MHTCSFTSAKIYVCSRVSLTRRGSRRITTTTMMMILVRMVDPNTKKTKSTKRALLKKLNFAVRQAGKREGSASNNNSQQARARKIMSEKEKS